MCGRTRESHPEILRDLGADADAIRAAVGDRLLIQGLPALDSRRCCPSGFRTGTEIAVVRAEAEKAEPGETPTPSSAWPGGSWAAATWGSSCSSTWSTAPGGIQLIVEQELDLDLGDLVGVTGARPLEAGRAVARRPRSSILLAKIRRPLPDTFHGLTDVETRYRQRYLDLLMNEDSRRLALTRARIVAAVRAYLDGEGFIEVETPILQPRYGGGFADPFVTHSNELDADLYLRIADELYLKRLIVGGLEKVYELSKDFRNESISYKHSPEFTQVEWYEAYADYRDTMVRTEQLVERAATGAIGTTKVTFRGHEIELAPPWQRG